MLNYFCCCLALFGVVIAAKKSKNGMDLLIEAINNEAVVVQNLPVSYYSLGQISAQTDVTNYFILRQCSESTANLEYVKLNIIAPDNPSFNITNNVYVVMELSSMRDVWNASTILYTNYIWDIRQPIIYNTMIWKFATGPKEIYGRYRSYGRLVAITLLISYSDGETELFGQYTENVIRPSRMLGDYLELHQYVKSASTHVVNNDDHIVLSFALCALEPPFMLDYTLTATVASDLSSPLAAFDLVACPVSAYPDPEDCTLSNLNAVVNQNAAALVSVTILHTAQIDLSQGVYLSVYGQGGNNDKSNKFVIQVEVEQNEI